MQEPDPRTVRAAQEGDLDAFETLVRDCQADAWRFAYHLTHHAATADDVTQEAFVRAFRAIRTYRGDARFTSWLLRIVRNCAVDAHQRAKREASLAERAARATPESVPPPLTEERMRIHDAIGRLPAKLREPFVMIEVLGYSYPEASDVLGVRLGTLKSRMHRARAALMRALTEEEAAGEV